MKEHNQFLPTVNFYSSLLVNIIKEKALTENHTEVVIFLSQKKSGINGQNLKISENK